MVNNSYWKIKGQSLKKHRIIEKYIWACNVFDKKYNNAVFIDTHGGSGKVLNLENGTYIDGSPILASKISICHIVEVNRRKMDILKVLSSNYPNWILHEGDCNDLIYDILNEIPRGEKFVFSLIDPNALAYSTKGKRKPQLICKTIETIGEFPRSEILVNFMVSGFLRIIPGIINGTFRDYLTLLLGTSRWKEEENITYEKLKDIFINELLVPYYKYINYITVNVPKNNVPIYYLLYGTNKEVGFKIMSSIFEQERKEIAKFERRRLLNKSLNNWF